MTKTAHTPGPWFANKNSAGYRDICIEPGLYAPSFGSIHQNPYIGIDDAKAEANARLIAAAPELLAALKRLRVVSTSIRDDLEAETVAALAEADTAIAKAEEA